MYIGLDEKTKLRPYIVGFIYFMDVNNFLTIVKIAFGTASNKRKRNTWMNRKGYNTYCTIYEVYKCLRYASHTKISRILNPLYKVGPIG